MNARTKLLSAALALTFVVVARPAGAALFDAFSTFDLQVKLGQAALGDGSVKLAPGMYEVHFTMAEDGHVRARFSQRGAHLGEARGTITVRKAGGEKTHTFKSLGFNSSSPWSFKQVGQRLSLEVGAPGSNQAFIWFELPPAAKR